MILENPYWRFVWPIPSTVRGIWYKRQWSWWKYFLRYYWCQVVGHIIVEVDYKYGNPPHFRGIECRRCSHRFIIHSTCSHNPEHGYADKYYLYLKECPSMWGPPAQRLYRNVYIREKALCDDCVSWYKTNIDKGYWSGTLRMVVSAAVARSH